MIKKIKNFFKGFVKIFQIKSLRKRVLITLLIFVVFRILANIPVPGINTDQVKAFFSQFQILGLVNAFTGGSMQQMSVVMLGLGPFINATVILQLLSMIFPALEKMYREKGDEGQEKFNQYGRMLTIPLACFQAYGMLALFQRQGVIEKLTPFTFASSILTIAAGTALLMWFSEIISEKGIGRGTSMIISAGIIARFPQNVFQLYYGATAGEANLLSYGLFFVLSLIIIFAVVLITQAQRRIPVSYAKRVRGRKMYGGAKTFLPLNINPAGVMPIIFALSLLTFPGMIANFFVGTGGKMGEIAKTVSALSEDTLVYSVFYFVLVFLFTFFYTMIVFDPENVAENLKNSGGFVPGHRPGKPTAHYLNYVLNRILPLGALFLATIALAPNLVGEITGVETFQFLVGGTSLLILVSVILETYQEINSYLQMREL